MNYVEGSASGVQEQVIDIAPATGAVIVQAEHLIAIEQ